MSDYTPSTDEVRADYVRDHTRNFDSYMTGRSLTSEQEVYGARYDRMIESVEAAAEQRGAKAERERIARLIEAHAATDYQTRRLAYENAARIAREGA